MKTFTLISEAIDDDNDRLVELAGKCAMDGQVGLCIDRRPEFLALNRLEGDDVTVGVARDHDGNPIGCVAVAKRVAYVNGQARQINYLSDLKVDPKFRDTKVALKLTLWANTCCVEGETDPLTFVTVLDGNKVVQRRTNTPTEFGIHQIGTVRSYSIGLLWKRKLPANELSITRATEGDAEEMIDLWTRVAPTRQLSTVFTPRSFVNWVNAAPGLDFGDYVLARDFNGKLLGWIGAWDQSSFKQTRITSYPLSLKLFKAAFNKVAPRFGTPTLPPVGGELQLLSAVHMCVPQGESETLRLLMLSIYDDYRDSHYSFFTIGLDKRDSMVAATKGLLAQATDIGACVCVHGAAKPMDLNDRPIHHEIALV